MTGPGPVGRRWAVLAIVACLLAGCGRDEAPRPEPEGAPPPKSGVVESPPDESPPESAAPDIGHAAPPDTAPPATAPLREERPPTDRPGLVTVYYATDRRPWAPGPGWYAARFAWLGVVLVGGLLLGLLARRVVVEGVRRRLGFLRWAWGLGLLLLVLGGTYQCIRMSQRVDRLPLQYGADRALPDPATGSVLSYGTAEVSIPPEHATGRVETPSFWEGDWFEDPKRHMVVRSLRPQLPDEFWEGVRGAVARSPRADAFVFVHGYNVSFEDGALRAGQIANDLRFEGAPVLYSWPSQGRVEDYKVDENMVDWTVSHLEAFLVELRRRSGAQRVHLLGHSMGNRALAEALERISMRPEPRFDQVVLAAPDIDAATFRQDAHLLFGTCSRLTLYASSRDAALLVSRRFNGDARAGEAGDDLVVLDGMDTVDVSAVTGSHSYIGDNGRVLGDLGDLLTKRLPVTERRGLVERAWRGLKYWLLEQAGG